MKSRMESTSAPFPRTNLVHSLVDYFRSEIMKGHFSLGERLPNEVELANRLTVSRTPLREAMKILHTLGLIEIRHGDGTFVTAKIPVKSYMTPLISMINLDRKGVADLMEFRKILEVESVRLATKRALPKHIKKLNEVVKRQEEKIKNREDYSQESFEFHYYIAEATGNVVITKIFEIIGDLLVGERRKYAYASGAANHSTDLHKAILSAITDGEAEEAARLILDHLTVVEKSYLKLHNN